MTQSVWPTSVWARYLLVCDVHARAQAEGEAWNARVGSRKAAANDGRTFQLRATMYLSA